MRKMRRTMTMTIDGPPRTLLPLNSRRLFVSLRIWLERPERWLGSMILLNEVDFVETSWTFIFPRRAPRQVERGEGGQKSWEAAQPWTVF